MKIRDFIETVRDYIRSQHLLKRTDKCLVALSGGADSVTLLLCLKQLDYEVEAVHCNFHLRGDESDRDEQFCEDLCRKLEVPLHKAHFDTRTYVSLHKVSIEMAARTLRYGYFEQLRQLLGFEAIAVAHHRDDNAETVLMNLARGTGLKGLCGIQPRNGYIIRPLLCTTHTEILAFLDEMGQNHVEDSTNSEDEAQRNQIRHHAIPSLRGVNPAVVLNISRTAERLSAAWSFLEKSVHEQVKWHKESNGRLSVPVQNVDNEYVLWFLLSDYGFNSSQVESLYNAISQAGTQELSGKQWYSKSHLLVVDRMRLQMIALDGLPIKEMKIPMVGTYIYDERHRFKINEKPLTADYQVSKATDLVDLDAENVCFPLTIRPLREGDRFTPFGMKGSKLVSDFLTDRKLSVIDKRLQLVVTDAQDHILWLVGQRIDNQYRVTFNTRSVLEIAVTVVSDSLNKGAV